MSDAYTFEPDPWNLGRGAGSTWDNAICDGPFIVARVTGGGYPIGEGWSPRSEAQARLLAAAPELLAALRPLLARAQELYDGRTGTWDNLAREIAAAEAAIAKVDTEPKPPAARPATLRRQPRAAARAGKA